MLVELGTQETGRSQATPKTKKTKTNDHCVMVNSHDNRPVNLKSVNCDHHLYTVGINCPV